MKWALVDSNSIVQNFIMYDGSSPYSPPNGLQAQQVNDWLLVGQNINTPQPSGSTPVLTPAQQAAVALAAGVVLTSSSTPALNGTYACDDQTTIDINAIVTFIQVNGAFPAGVTQLPWPDIGGTMHVFPTTASFTAFATAVANFVAVVKIYRSSNGAVGAIPSNAITIP